MDRRGWPWKKKSSEKTTEKTASGPDPVGSSLASAGSQGDQDNSKKVNYVQISVESYAHLTEMEDEVKTLNDQVKALNDEVDTLNEKLSSAHSENSTKDNLVKQHAKVAEEAVSGWEKAEAEALALKHQLESVTLLKLTAEDRASHLDGALKECMRQIRNLKEEHEKKLHEIILTKTKQWDKIKLEFEAKIADLDQELLKSSAENAAFSRSLQERSNILMKISEEKSQAEADIELLKSNIQSCEREISSLKYELHIVSKELDIRNEEKNMSMRSAEVANKQHLEGVKKIAKLEAECQRLRGLVRKKLPGPAALAQMKLEVENLGRDYGDTRLRRSPGQNPSPHLAPPPEISLDNVQQFHKETEFLTARLLTMEEETNMLKEALAKRNSELQTSRNMCAKTTSKLRSLEAQIQLLNHQKSSPRPNVEIPAEGSLSQNASNPPSLTSVSEDGVDEEGSCAESWASTLISELSHLKKERNMDKANKASNPNHLELMDDFLEMERLACLSTESNGPTSISGSFTNKGTANEDHPTLTDVAKGRDLPSEQQSDLDPLNQVSYNEKFSAAKFESDTDEVQLSKLQSRISMIFTSEAKDANMGKILKDIKCVVQDLQNALPQHSVSCVFEDTHSPDVTGNQLACPQDIGETTGNMISLAENSKPGIHAEHIIDQELVIAISQIHDFVISLGKETMTNQDLSPDGHALSQKVEEFSDSVNKVLCSKISLGDFVLCLSHVLAKASELSISFLGYKGNEGETNNSDCVDKVTLLEKKVVQDDSLHERYPNGCAHLSPSTSDAEILQEESSSPGFDLKVASCTCSLEDLEQLKSEKDGMAMELARCTENLEHTKCQLEETEQRLAELKSQLASSQKSNSLAETQLKCMAESYKSLETRAEELEAEGHLLHAKTETLEHELQGERKNYEDALAKCKDLEEQMQRNDGCSMCTLSAAEDSMKSKQEKEIAAAAEKLAECQETIFLLGRQLNSLRPPLEHTEDEGRASNFNLHTFSSQEFDQAETVTVASSNVARVGSESPSDVFESPLSPSDAEMNLILRSPVNSRRSKYKPSKSSSSSSVPTPEKQSHGFSRFFSSKSKSGN